MTVKTNFRTNTETYQLKYYYDENLFLKRYALSVIKFAIIMRHPVH